MAQKVIVQMLDDIDGGMAAETVTFALDGVTYEIDLSEKNAAALRAAVTVWASSARRVGGRLVTRATQAPKSARQAPERDMGAVRAWARENGYQVPDRGRVSGEVLRAFDTKTPAPQPEAAPAPKAPPKPRSKAPRKAAAADPSTDAVKELLP